MVRSMAWPQALSQLQGFSSSPSFCRSSLKGKKILHGNRIVEHRRSMLKSLYLVGMKNLEIYIWLWILLDKTKIKYSKKLSLEWRSPFVFVFFFRKKKNGYFTFWPQFSQFEILNTFISSCSFKISYLHLTH